MQYILELEMPNFPYIANALTYFPTHTQKKKLKLRYKIM